jgi:hypothetical protein
MGTPLVPGWVAGSSRDQSPRLSLGVVKVCWTGDLQPSGMSTSGATRFSTELRQEVGDAWDVPTVVVIRRREWPGERTMTSVEGSSRSAAADDAILTRDRMTGASGNVRRAGWADDRFIGVGSSGKSFGSWVRTSGVTKPFQLLPQWDPVHTIGGPLAALLFRQSSLDEGFVSLQCRREQPS